LPVYAVGIYTLFPQEAVSIRKDSIEREKAVEGIG
jgi:hypothetical protein